MKKTANMHQSSLIGRATHNLIGFPCPMIEKAVSESYCLHTVKQVYAPAQIVMSESRIIKFLKNL